MKQIALCFLQKEVGQKSFKTSSDILGSTLVVTYVSAGMFCALFIAAVFYDFLYVRPRKNRETGSYTGIQWPPHNLNSFSADSFEKEAEPQGRIQDFGQEGVSGVLTPGGLNPKFAHNYLKTAGEKNLGGSGGPGLQGPLDLLVLP